MCTHPLDVMSIYDSSWTSYGFFGHFHNMRRHAHARAPDHLRVRAGPQGSAPSGTGHARWLGQRTILFWGDSLTGQQFYSLVFLLGSAVDALHDVPNGNLSAVLRGSASSSAEHLPNGPRPNPLCSESSTKIGDEGGPLSVAMLRGGGRLIKVLGHAEMIEQAKHAAGAWWLGLWQQADIVVFNVGHHFRNIDGSFRKLAAEGANSLAKHSKPGARIIFRTSNVGHFKLR